MPQPGQRLSAFAEIWKKSGADPSLLALIRDGHKINFEDAPPPCTLPAQRYETKLANEQMTVIRSEVASLLAKGAIHEVPRVEAESVPAHYSQIYCGTKARG